MSIETIGFAGCPPEDRLRKHKNVRLMDLDNHYEGVEKVSETLLPANTCTIIKRILDNALGLYPDLVIIDEGYGKCHHAGAVADILTGIMDIPVIKTRNDNTVGTGTPLCDSDLPPRSKAELILDGLTGSPSPPDFGTPASPPAAVWGVPASDFRLYDLFPDGTRLLGWFRCLENRTPADRDMELYVEPDVPTVFFAQSFCHKNITAKDLARGYAGLYVDIDGSMSNSVRAKIEAFLEFKVK